MTGRKWADLVNLSTMTHMDLFLFTSTRQAYYEVHIDIFRLSSGDINILTYTSRSLMLALTFKQFDHLATKFFMSLFILFHQ